MKSPIGPFILAVVSVILGPPLIYVEFVALLFADMVVAEPANPIPVKILTVVLVVAIGALTLTVPLVALVMGFKVRAASKETPSSRTGLATAAVVIAGFVTLVVVLAQVYVLLTIFGQCALDGC